MLAEKKKEVFVVHLLEAKRVDHAVVVDANSGIIVDIEESTALVLSADVLSDAAAMERATQQW